MAPCEQPADLSHAQPLARRLFRSCKRGGGGHALDKQKGRFLHLQFSSSHGAEDSKYSKKESDTGKIHWGLL